VAQAKPEPVFSVGFDEDALAEDLERLSAGAGEALEAFRKELRRDGGLPKSRLKACHDDGQDRTMLAGCVKTYVPWPDGRFGAASSPSNTRSVRWPYACSPSGFGITLASQTPKPSTKSLIDGSTHARKAVGRPPGHPGHSGD